MDKKVFITGITGYIGGSVAKLLAEKGYKISGLVRKESSLKELENMNIDEVLGNIQEKNY